jgi:hypothetical protein
MKILQCIFVGNYKIMIPIQKLNFCFTIKFFFFFVGIIQKISLNFYLSQRIEDSIEIREFCFQILNTKKPSSTLFKKCNKIFLYCFSKKDYSILQGEFEVKDVIKPTNEIRRKNNRKKMTFTSIEKAASSINNCTPLSMQDPRINDLSYQIKLSSINSKCKKAVYNFIQKNFELKMDSSFAHFQQLDEDNSKDEYSSNEEDQNLSSDEDY